MQALYQNKQTVYFAQYSSATKAYDSDGNYTGEKPVNYGSINSVEMNVSYVKGAVDVSRGQAHLEEYGIDTNYVATLVTDDKACPINETSVLWIGVEPTDEQGNPVPYNYSVLRRLPSLNSITYVCREVDVK